jgi:glutamine amidotransferase
MEVLQKTTPEIWLETLRLCRMEVAIIDYGLGNVASLQKAIKYLGKSSVITNDKDIIRNSKFIFLPGVGSFGAGMKNLRELNLIEVLNSEVIESKKPFFGICLGMQLIAKKGHENGIEDGLGWIDAEAVKIETNDLIVPHMGWNNLIDCKSIFTPFLNKDFYFVHSYHLQMAETNSVASKVEYGEHLTAAIHQGNIVATQFHPEKSQKAGLQLIDSFFNFYD